MTSIGKEPECFDISTLKPNSNVSKEEKHVEKVVKGQAKIRKKTLGEKFSETFLSDEVGDVKSYLVFDVLIPALKDTIFDMFKTGLEMTLFGDSRPKNVQRSNRYGGGSGSHTSYQSYSDHGSSRGGRTWSQSEGRYDRKPSRDFGDIVFPDRADAEHVLSNLVELIDMYGVASVADFKTFAGIKKSWTDDDIGWDALGSAKIIRTREGFILDLPRPVPLEV